MSLTRMTSAVLISLLPLLACSEPPPPSNDGNEEAGSTDVIDGCPVSGGIEWNGRTRFMYGINYAWDGFGSDFGGLETWRQPGVADSREVHAAAIADMRDHGANVIRWWVFPDFRGDGVVVDEEGLPIGLGGGVDADLEAALELAEQEGVYLMLTLFSFDGLRPDRDNAGVFIPSLAPMVRDADKRKALLENVVRPLARQAQSSPYHPRLIAWDVFNEPEWAIAGDSPYGDPPYTPMDDLDAVRHEEMELFLAETIDVLRQESIALVTVGATGMKWTQAWMQLDVDFYQFHWYDWLDDHWSYRQPASSYLDTDKPVMVGEFPMTGINGAPYADLVASWYGTDYAGSLGWDYMGNSGHALGQADKEAMASFATEHSCETSYDIAGEPCTDIAPDTQYTCAQQVGWGKCGEAWMEGYCDESCGRCTAPEREPPPCADIPPDTEYTCAQQVDWGKCSEPWMDGYCDESCGRCST